MVDYFQTLGIEPSFALDMDRLQRAYVQLQQQYHPDRQTGKSAEDRQKAALASAEANEAFRVLKEDYPRACHLLELQDIRVQGDDANIKADNSLLMEVMEWNEQLEAADTATARNLQAQWQEERKALLESLKQKLEPQAVIRLGYLEKTLSNLNRKLRVLNT